MYARCTGCLALWHWGDIYLLKRWTTGDYHLDLSSVNWWWVFSVHFSHPVVSDSLWSHGLQHARLLCLSPTPRACSNSCPLSQWCHPTISSSVLPFSSRIQCFPASGSFPMSQIYASDDQSISCSFSISPSKEYLGLISFRIDWFDLLASPRGSQESSPTPQFKSICSLALSFLYSLSHPYMTIGKTTVLTI